MKRERQRYFVEKSGYLWIKAQMEAANITPDHAFKLIQAYEQCWTTVRDALLPLDPIDPAFILEMNRLGKQNEGRGSDTYREIIASGYLQFTMINKSVPVNKAAAWELRDLLDEKMRLHKRFNAMTPSVNAEPVVLTLWRGQPAKNYAALRQMLHDDDFAALTDLFKSKESA